MYSFFLRRSSFVLLFGFFKSVSRIISQVLYTWQSACNDRTSIDTCGIGLYINTESSRGRNKTFVQRLYLFGPTFKIVFLLWVYYRDLYGAINIRVVLIVFRDLIIKFIYQQKNTEFVYVITQSRSKWRQSLRPYLLTRLYKFLNTYYRNVFRYVMTIFMSKLKRNQAS